MRRPVLKATLVLLSVGGLLTLGMSPALADGSRGDRNHDEIQQTVHVVGTGSAVQIDHSTIRSGSIRFKVSTTNPQTQQGGGSQVSLFKLKSGVSVSRFNSDLADEFSQNPKVAARGTRELTRDVRVAGLADVVPGTPAVVTEFLAPGSYYLMDLGNGKLPPALTSLTVRKARENVEQDSDLTSQVTVSVTSADRFIAPRNWPDEGTYTFHNVSDTLHFMSITPVKPGTTDQQISDFFSGKSSNVPLLPGPSVGNDVVSPGGSLQLTYDLPAGTYVLVCFVADDVTGMPHALMGMHKVVVLH